MPNEPASTITDEELSRFARYFSVSQHAMLIRLVHLGYVRESFYWNNKKSKFDTEEANYKQFGRALYYGTRYRNTLGDLYTGLVIEAWNTGRITNHNAAEYMGIKIFHIFMTFANISEMHEEICIRHVRNFESFGIDARRCSRFTLRLTSRQLYCHRALSL